MSVYEKHTITIIKYIKKVNSSGHHNTSSTLPGKPAAVPDQTVLKSLPHGLSAHLTDKQIPHR